ncbi:hypothetical protein INR49_025630 [Caranx melampygus]|nr:hypothetical protein INR49_025630 [Caranx melampygus]
MFSVQEGFSDRVGLVGPVKQLSCWERRKGDERILTQPPSALTRPRRALDSINDMPRKAERT